MQRGFRGRCLATISIEKCRQDIKHNPVGDRDTDDLPVRSNVCSRVCLLNCFANILQQCGLSVAFVTVITKVARILQLESHIHSARSHLEAKQARASMGEILRAAGLRTCLGLTSERLC
jgi:hypothetical protein